MKGVIFVRATKHNGRGPKNSKNGYNPKHNDRDFESEKNSDENVYYNSVNDEWYVGNCKGEISISPSGKILSFEEAERTIYKERYYQQYETQMERYRKKGNHDRIKSFDEWRNSKRYAPEETILQIGKSENHADKNTLLSAAMEFVDYQEKWSKQHGDCFVIDDFAVHFDETVPHAHLRKTWQYRDANGMLCVGQDKALEQAGIELPDPSKQRGRFNNRKMVYDKMMRDKWIEICKKKGLEIEEEALPDGKHNQTKEEMIAQKYQDIIDKTNAKELEYQALTSDYDALKLKRDGMAKEIEDMDTLKAGIEKKYKQEYDEKKTFLENLYKSRNKAVDERESKLDDRETELDERASKLDDDRQNFDKLVEEKAIQKAREMFSRVNDKAEEAQTQTRTNDRRAGYIPWEME